MSQCRCAEGKSKSKIYICQYIDWLTYWYSKFLFLKLIKSTVEVCWIILIGSTVLYLRTYQLPIIIDLCVKMSSLRSAVIVEKERV